MSEYVDKHIAKIITPDDPEWRKPLVMGDPYKQGLTPKTAQTKRVAEFDRMRQQEGSPIKYATSAIAHAPDAWMPKLAQTTGIDNMMTQPMWFSPLHTPQNWQIASKRREIYQWMNIKSCQITTDDYTCQPIADLDFIPSDIVEDVITGGVLYENIQSEQILAGQGVFRQPLRYSVREAKDKRCFAFHAYGYWRDVEVSEEHPMIVLDGKSYRHKRKLEKNAIYRRSKGIPAGGDKPKIEFSETLIERKEAQNVFDKDYLLAPVPQMGNKKIANDQAWLLGVVIADGTLVNYEKGRTSKRVSITLDKNEYHRKSILSVLELFDGKTSETSHQTENGWRISKHSKYCWDFCSKYITGKKIEKRFTAELFNLSEECRLHVLGGYFDGDGSYSKAEGKLIANNYSCDMADQIYWLLLSVGIRASLGRYPLYGDHYETDSKWCYRIFIPQSDINKLKPYMRSDKIPDDFIAHNTRELRFFYEEDGVTYLAQPIESIKQFRYTGIGYDLQIDPERSFVASGFVTSNCRFFYENEPKVGAAIDFYCFVPETQVLMGDGQQKPIVAIKPGEMVCSHDGSINEVLRIFNRDADETVIAIDIVDNNKKLITSLTHKLLVKRGEEIKYIQAGDLNPGDCLVLPAKYKCFISDRILGEKQNSYILRIIRGISYEKYAGRLYDIEVRDAHSYIANGIVCSNSQFPMNGFKLECKSRKIMKWFEHYVVKRLNLNELFKQISQEYFMLGDVFVHTDIECPVCGGSSVDPDTNEPCNHPEGLINKITILNPDWIEVQKSPLSDEPVIVLIPDEDMKRIVFTKNPKVIYDRIPDAMKELIMHNRPIPLSNRTTSQIKHMPAPYGIYGSSIIRRLFTTLAYKTKIMTANWIVAERLILPVRVVKIGSDARPATSADIADIQQQLGQTANDPNLTIVTHNNFDYEWYGAAGKVLQITQEMEHIDKELLDGLMLNQALLNGEMSGYQCHDEETEVLTNEGFLPYSKAKNKEILTYNLSTKTTEYQVPTAFHEYDYDGTMIEFSGEQIDIKVTPNHKMLIRNTRRGWEEIFADKVTPGMRFLAHADYYGQIPSPFILIDEKQVDIRYFLKFAGYYLSEGSLSCKTSNYQISVPQSEEKNNNTYLDIKKTFKNLGFKYSEYRYKNKVPQFTICSKSLAIYMNETFGNHSTTKSIPSWIKNLSPIYLKVLLDALVNGDGQTIEHKNTQNYIYTSISERLVDDVQEIAFKCGFNVRRAKYYDKSNDIWLYRAKFSSGLWSKGDEPRVAGRHVSKVSYKGKVWCFTVANGFFVTRRNGKITIQGNSAQVGVETLIRRIEAWRHKLKEWCEEFIFKPIAEMQGFIDRSESEEIGETIYLYPEIKWNRLQLRDDQPRHQILMQLHDKQVISTQTLCEELELNYDQEVKRMRYEQTIAPVMGAMGSGAGGAGGMPGGMGGGAGGAPGMDMGGGMPGAGMAPMDSGMMGGGMAGGGMGGGMGGGGMGGGMGGPAMAAGGKVMKKGKQPDQEEVPQEMTMIKLTAIEQKMAGMLESIASTAGIDLQKIRAQFPIQNPTGGKPYSIDFAMPDIKLGVECDGEVWHSSEEQVDDDKKRDYLLAQRGWTILRFDDKTIDDAPQAVKATINGYIQKALNPTKAASIEEPTVHLFGIKKGDLIYLPNNYAEYNQRGLSHVVHTSSVIVGNLEC